MKIELTLSEKEVEEMIEDRLLKKFGHRFSVSMKGLYSGVSAQAQLVEKAPEPLPQKDAVTPLPYILETS